MTKVESYCGIICSECTYREEFNCPGCLACKGKVFHGTCEVAVCCIEHKIDHCGLCEEFPCKLLNDFSYDKEHGDNGERIKTLKDWINLSP